LPHQFATGPPAIKQADVFDRYLMRHSDVGGVNGTLHAKQGAYKLTLYKKSAT